MINWRWDCFMAPFIFFSWGAAMYQEFGANSWMVSITAALMLGFRLRR